LFGRRCRAAVVEQRTDRGIKIRATRREQFRKRLTLPD
jgi:hypothetical protein